MEALRSWATEALGLSPAVQARLLTTLVMVLVLVLVRWIVLNAVHRRVSDLHLQYRWRRGITYAMVILGAVLATRIWLVNFGGLATYLGLLSAGLAIALKDPLASLAAWLFILWRRPIEIGERVQVGSHLGDVVDIRLFQFTMLEIGNWVAADQTTGRLINLPNSLVFTTPVANYTRGFHSIWTEIPVLLTFESNWQEARGLLLAIAERHGRESATRAGVEMSAAARRYALPQSSIDPAVYLSVQASGVLLTLRAPCDPRGRRKVDDAIWQDVLLAFAMRPDIDFAYPTTRFYANPTEGKPGARANVPR